MSYLSRSNLSIMDDMARCNACGINYYKKGNVFSFICRAMYQEPGPPLQSDEEHETAVRIVDFWGKGWEKRLAEPEHDYIFLLDHDEICKMVFNIYAAQEFIIKLKSERADSA